MVTKNSEGYFQIPSELIEDKLPSILGDWLAQYGRGEITWDQFESRMDGVWWFLNKNGAIHSVLAWNNSVHKITTAYKSGHLLEVIRRANAKMVARVEAEEYL